MNKIVTAIDLGSNSFRVVVYDFSLNKIVNEYQEVVGMADGLSCTGLISKEAQQRVISAILNSSEKLNYVPQNAICVTTAAMRYASNNQEVIKNFKEKTGASFKIIEANEEARLTLLAIKYALKREKNNCEKFVVLDIGGGSTELIFNTSDKYITKSFSFGIVTLTQKYNDIKKIKDRLEELKKEIKLFVDSLNININQYDFIATAGTPTIVASIKLGLDINSYDRNLINATKITIKDLENCLEIFHKKNSDEISQLVGKGRTDFIEVGILIFQTIFESLKKDSTIVFDDGLREGVALDYFLRQ